MDPILFILTIVAAGIAAAALLLPSESPRVHWSWDEDDLRNQLGAGR